MDATRYMSLYNGLNYLEDPSIPLYPPLVVNPALVELSRKKSMELCRLADAGLDIEREYPDAYREMTEDLGPLATDFDGYVRHVEGVLSELQADMDSSGKDRLEKYEYALYYGRAKFRSALVVFSKDHAKIREVHRLIGRYNEIPLGNIIEATARVVPEPTPLLEKN